MRSKQRKRLAVSTAGLGAIAGALVGGQMDAIAAHDAARHPNPGVEIRTSTTNDVGCIKTTVTRPDAHGHAYMGSFLFTYPQGLDIESLSDSELRSCGLPIRRGFRNLPTTSPRYQAWLAEARAQMSAKQSTLWDAPQYPPGYVPPPAPPGPTFEGSGSPPDAVTPPSWHHSSLERSSVAPATVEDPLNNYNVVTTQSDAGREILDATFSYQNGDAAGPDITVTIYPSSDFVLPGSTTGLVLTRPAS